MSGWPRASSSRLAGIEAIAPAAEDCPLARPGGPGHCRWCGNPLPKRRTSWCSDACARAYARNHWWPTARRTARRRDGYRCKTCKRKRSDGIRLEVNHIELAHGSHARISCAHHLTNLETLCNECHAEVTRTQRASAARA